MDQVTTEYYTITAESMARERERLYEKARHDEAQALHHAEQKGRAEGREEGRQEGREEGRQEGREEGRQEEKIEIARKMKSMGDPLDHIMLLTNLDYSEIERL